MMRHPMKPETLKRRSIARRKAVAARKAEMKRRLEENAKRDGPDSIWAEMLGEVLS